MKKIIFVMLLIGLLIFTSIFVFPVSSKNVYLTSTGNTLYVGGSGLGNYSKIQDAVDNAENGSTIYVYSGIYSDSVTIDKSISLIGEDKNTTIIDRDGKENAPIYITCDNVIVTGFTLMSKFNRFSTYMPGIAVYSSFNHIYNNNISENGQGILLSRNTNNNSITNNFFYNNTWFGGSPSYGYGISMSETTNDNIISNNYFYNNHYGILFRGSRNIISDNQFYKDGIYTYDPGYDNVLSNNMVNDKPFVYLYGGSDQTIDGYAGQICLVNCDNIVVKNNEISNVVSAVTLLNSHNCKIFENEFSETLNECIAVIDSDNNEIQRNNILENKKGDAFIILRSDNNLIKENNMQKSKWGMLISKSHYNTIDGNNFIKNTRRSGIYASYISNTVFINNNISENRYDGVFIKDSEDCEFKNNIFYNNGKYNYEYCGIYVYGICKNFLIENNLFDSNYKYGVLLYFSDNIEVKNNIFINNDIGLSVHHSNKNLITKNNFINNNESCTFEYDYTCISKPTKWKNNYYDDLDNRKIIPGFFGIFKNYGSWGVSRFPTYMFRFPWFKFDLTAAENPHEIIVGGSSS